ncbi:MAG: hypothetical protein KGI50_08005 [Patescibacteria group bacterium]|nr:hypothetical protein [Patescibacteria group bacterium]
MQGHISTDKFTQTFSIAQNVEAIEIDVAGGYAYITTVFDTGRMSLWLNDGETKISCDILP